MQQPLTSPCRNPEMGLWTPISISTRGNFTFRRTKKAPRKILHSFERRIRKNRSFQPEGCDKILKITYFIFSPGGTGGKNRQLMCFVQKFFHFSLVNKFCFCFVCLHCDQLQHFHQFHQQVLEHEYKAELESLSNNY